MLTVTLRTPTGLWTVPCVNTAIDVNTHKLGRGFPFVALWHMADDGKLRWRLRSAPDGVDVSVVAAVFGGEGTRHHATFASDLSFLGSDTATLSVDAL